ncbi:4-oxalocrotonate tautomerase family protein [Lacibacterium aquatile]|uniref:Tautomerase n=1 Tax=Lacibacterium aquatile TaxID=1168082 RepID=A0ABW5DSS9_9PROT
MPYVNIKVTRERSGPVTPEQKAELIKGVTDLLKNVLNKNPATTVVVIDEVEMDNWGIGGLPAEEYRAFVASQKK